MITHLERQLITLLNPHLLPLSKDVEVYKCLPQNVTDFKHPQLKV